MKIIDALMARSRRRKYRQFMELCRPNEHSQILDLGVSDVEYRSCANLFEKLYPFKNRITCLGIDDLQGFTKRYPEVRAVTYDGRIFPFGDKTFDFVWCNAVIEHVGPSERQKLFLSEIMRVTRRKVYLTTPNKGFPFEIHTRLPFVHWLPKKTSDWFYRNAGKKWAAGDFMNLLGQRDLTAMLAGLRVCYPFSYRIMRNRFLGFTSTFSVLIEMLEEPTAAKVHAEGRSPTAGRGQEP